MGAKTIHIFTSVVALLATSALAVGGSALTRHQQILAIAPSVDAAVAGWLVAVRQRLERRRQLDDLDERSL